MEHPLVVTRLKKVYGPKNPFLAVNEVSFSLKSGEILGLLGPNGSGKTTIIQMLLAILTPTSGEILYFGKDLATHRSELLQSLSFASTYTNLPYVLTVWENLNCIGHFYQIENIAAKVIPLLERFGIADKKHAPVSSLSEGQKTRLMLVKAFFTNPRIALLDEPTASLDPDISMDVCRFLLEEREKTGMAILFTSHKMNEVAKLCDRTIFLKNGAIIADDIPANLARSSSLFELRLTISEGMEKTIEFAQQKGWPYQSDHRIITLSLEEKEIPLFLHGLTHLNVAYATIQIKEPSLENYFVKIAESSR